MPLTLPIMKVMTMTTVMMNQCLAVGVKPASIPRPEPSCMEDTPRLADTPPAMPNTHSRSTRLPALPLIRSPMRGKRPEDTL